jgi:flagellin-like protein
MLNRIKKSVRAISPVLSALMMIAVAVTASLVTYAWIMGYLNFTTTKTAKAIQIQSAAINDYTQKLLVYVQNVGTGPVQFDLDKCVYINSESKACTINSGNNPLEPGQTVTLSLDEAETFDSLLKIKVVTSEGTSTEKSIQPQQFTINPAIFNNGFESGDFNAWTGTTGSPTVTNAQYHHGSYSCLIDADGEGVYKNFASSYSTAYGRLYFRCSAAAEYQLFGLKASGTPGLGIGFFEISADGKWQLAYRNGGNWYYNTATTGPSANTWYCVELKVVVGSGTGEERVYIDGSELTDLAATGLANNDRGNVQSIVISNYNPSATQIWFDCVVVADAYIGP